MQARHVFMRQLQASPLHPKASSYVVVRHSTSHDSQSPKLETEDGAEATEDHGGSHELHGAAHQATHRVSEKLGFAVLERAVDRLLGRAAGAGERVAIKAGERAAERVGERAAQQAAARAGERVAARVAAGAGERVAERAGKRAAASIAERVGERAGERLLERAGESAAARGAEVALSRGADRLGVAAAQRTVERAAERAAERAGQKGASVAGEKLAERALEQAARHASEGGSRAALEHLGERVALRLGRGMTIAVPALGSLFVLHMVRSDRRRAREEQERGNLTASRAFWLAFLCDASDVAAHVVIVTSLLHTAYGVGPWLPHHWLHAAEWGGVAVSVVSTIAAVVGEMLAAGWRWKQAQWPQFPWRWWNKGAPGRGL